MRNRSNYLFFLLCITTAALAGTKEYTILGDQKIKASVRDGAPLPAEKSGISIEGAGFAIGDGKLIWAFDFASKKAPTKVVVEDVSGKSAILLVEDSTPKFDGGHWTGEATPVALTKSGCPWLFEPGDSTKVFRFSVWLRGKPEPVVIYQPAVYPEETKKQLQQMAR